LIINGSMDHDHIDAEDVAGRYLAGTLPDDERQRFEEHFLDCPRCVDVLERLDGLQQGLRTVAAEDVARVPPGRIRRPAWRSFVAAAAGIAAAIALVAGGALWLRERRELGQTSARVADLARRYDEAQAANRDLSARVQALERSGTRPADASASPPVSVPVFALTTVRAGAGGAAVNRVTLSGSSPLIVLALEIEAHDAASRYRAVLKDGQGRELWHGEDLAASAPDTLGIALASKLLGNGTYVLEIARRRSDADAWSPAGRYAFNVAGRSR
jgi:Putative zinc-finger